MKKIHGLPREVSVVLLLCFFCLLPVAAMAGQTGQGKNEGRETVLEIIKLHKRPAGEILSAARSALSPVGRASVDVVSNAIIVIDTPRNIEQIRQLISELDQPTPQVIVRIRYHGKQQNFGSRRLSTSTGAGTLKSGRKLSTGNLNREQTLMLRVSSGSSGYLSIGKEIPLDRYWIDLCHRYGYRFGWLSGYKTIETGFEVRPLVLGSTVELTLTPRFSFAEDRVITFTKTSTRITVPQNSWTTISATDPAKNELMEAIVAGNRESTAQFMVLEVKASVR